MKLAFNHMPAGLVLLILGAHLVAGAGVGVLYFGGLWWNARLFVQSRGVAVPLAFVGVRFVLLAGVLTLASLEGALPLLVTALGIVVARFAVMRRLRGAAS